MNAHNGQSAPLQPTLQTKLQTPPVTPPVVAARTTTSSLPPRPATTDRTRSSAPPARPNDDARAMVRVAVEEALAPLRERLDDLERSMLETIVRLSASSPTTQSPPRSGVSAAKPSTRPTPPPLPKSVAPRAAATTPSPSAAPPPVQAFVEAEPLAEESPPDQTPSDQTSAELVGGVGERKRRQIVAALAGVIVLGVGTLFGMLASCS